MKSSRSADPKETPMESSALLPPPELDTPPFARVVAPPPDDRPQNTFRRVLQDRARLLEEIADGKRLSLAKVAGASFALTAVGGLGLGVANGATQALAAAIKLPIISAGAIAVCFPALYVFSLL